MDKRRHPHVVRTWTVERTKVPYRPPQPAKPRPLARRARQRAGAFAAGALYEWRVIRPEPSTARRNCHKLRSGPRSIF
jgi:hypothetical protein